ncbi:MAG: iron hydrogenase small subunit [Candidatus Moduliflexus flocculans]|nr:iron hydrogenase small subunit [Candidatus Moduliflexus flocculans]
MPSSKSCAVPAAASPAAASPFPTNNEIRVLRSAALYKDDGKVQKKRQSHENESVKKLYDKFLKEPLGHKSHKLLHTKYIKRGDRNASSAKMNKTFCSD